MRQGGEPLNDAELRAVIENIGTDVFAGLGGIDAENTAPYFDEALESLVQQYGLWAKGYNVDAEYNRRDLRDDAIYRSLWAILVVQGYAPVGNESDYGNWDRPSDDTHHEISRKRSEAWDVLGETQ